MRLPAILRFIKNSPIPELRRKVHPDGEGENFDASRVLVCGTSPFHFPVHPDCPTSQPEQIILAQSHGIYKSTKPSLIQSSLYIIPHPLNELSILVL